jgi:hypothetical protein
MLLTCCFRDQSSAKKGSRRKKHEEDSRASPAFKKVITLEIRTAVFERIFGDLDLA